MQEKKKETPVRDVYYADDTIFLGTMETEMQNMFSMLETNWTANRIRNEQRKNGRYAGKSKNRAHHE